MVYRPDRYCAVIGRTGPYRAAASRRLRRKVILTTLSVMDISFGRVTVPTDREPARAGHDRTSRAREAGRGERPGSVRGSQRPGPVGRRRDGGQPVCRRHLGTEIADSDHMPGLSIGWAVLFRDWPSRQPEGKYLGHYQHPGNRRSARLCACFAELRLWGWPTRPARGAAVIRPAFLARPRADPGRRELAAAAMLVCSPVSSRSDTTNGHRSWPEQHPAGILLITRGNMGSARPTGLVAG
jgi:hypothetical protein